MDNQEPTKTKDTEEQNDSRSSNGKFINWLKDKWDEIDYSLSEWKGVVNILELITWILILNSLFSYGANEYRTFGGEISFKSLWWSTPVFVKTGIFWLLPLAFTMVYRISPIFAGVLRVFSIRLEPTFNERYSIKRAEEISLRNLSRSEIAEKYVQSLVSSSTSLSKDIYSKGSVYLLFGVLFSIVGLLFFYFQIHSLKFDGNLTNAIITMVPNFGVLIFLEFISFFFLKQYRASMDDFRYYEAIKRSREETLAVIKLLAISDEKRDYLSILDNLSFSSAVGKLETGQTSEFIEAKKYDKNEMDVLAKIVEAISKK